MWSGIALVLMSTRRRCVCPESLDGSAGALVTGVRPFLAQGVLNVRTAGVQRCSAEIVSAGKLRGLREELRTVVVS